MVALCIIATPVLAAYDLLPACGPNPTGSDKCYLSPGTPESNNGVTPDQWNDNPTCTDLGFEQGIKFDPPNPVTSGNILWNFDPSDPFVTWSSSFPIDAVIMKGGSGGANVYHYAPSSTGDSGLATPITGGSGQPAGLSHIDFCYHNECTCVDDGNECTADICDARECVHSPLPLGTECSIGKCDAIGTCVQGTPVPEFPSIALPVALTIGLIGIVYYTRLQRN